MNMNMGIHHDTPSLKTLRYIANYIGVLSKEDVFEFLEDCGVKAIQMESGIESRKIIYHIFKKLASSDKDDDHALLVKIISDSINPALYGKSNRTEEAIVNEYDLWLHVDGLQLADYTQNREYQIVSFIQPSADLERAIFQETKLEHDILRSVIKSYIKDIAEITIAYNLLLQTVDVFSQQSFPVDPQLNNYYLRLITFVEKKIDRIHTEIAKLYEPEDSIGAYPSSYIPHDVYKDNYGKPILFKPFTNLYLAEKEMEEHKLSWEDIKKQMNSCFGWIDAVSQEHKVNQVDTLPNQKSWNEVKMYLKHMVKVDYGDFFGFTGTKFWLKMPADKDLVISFHPKKGETTHPFCLLNAFVDYLKKNGTYDNGRLKAVIPQAVIIAYISANYSMIDPSNWQSWIKSTKGNLIKKMTDEDKKFIDIGDHDGKMSYPFSIKLPLNITYTS